MAIERARIYKAKSPSSPSEACTPKVDVVWVSEGSDGAAEKAARIREKAKQEAQAILDAALATHRNTQKPSPPTLDNTR